jgi:hypothetical protein
VYVSVPAAGGAHANTVVAVDPTTGTVGTAIPVGPEPSTLAISDDGRFVWVGINGAHAIQRIDLATGIAAEPIALGSDPRYGPYVAEDIVVVPGAPNTVAVALANQGISPEHAGVVVYRDGILLPDKTRRHLGPNLLQFCGSTNTLYGYNTEISDFGLYRLTISDMGIEAHLLARRLGVDFYMNLACAGELLYPSTGRVTDPRTLTLAGTYRRLTEYETAIAVDAAHARAYMFGSDQEASSGTGSGTLYVYQQHTFQLLETHTFPDVQGAARRLIGAGEHTFALLTRVPGDYHSRLWLLREHTTTATIRTMQHRHTWPPRSRHPFCRLPPMCSRCPQMT